MPDAPDSPHLQEGRHKLLRVFVGELDKAQGRPLHEAILNAANEHGVAGCTVLRGVSAYGASSRVHTARVLRLSEDLPIVIEIVDTEARITAFLDVLHPLLNESGGGGLITMEAVDVIRYFPKRR